MQEIQASPAATALSKSPLFSSLGREELDRLALMTTPMRFAPDDVVFREGDPGDALFVVVTGQLRVLVSTPSGDMKLNTLGPGDIFGEIAVLDGRGRTATVAANQESELLRIGRQEFLIFLEDYPRYMSTLLQIVAGRVRNTVQAVPDATGLMPKGASVPAGPGRSSAERLPRMAAARVQHYDDWTEMPEYGFSAAVTYRHIHEKLQMEGQPHLNVASFVTTWMEPEAEQLAYESISKNLVNVAEYAYTESIHRQVIAMTANLFHAELPKWDPESGEEAPIIGTTTVGSSEAVMLGLLVHKWNWVHRKGVRRHAKDRPFLIFGTHTHACFAKFAKYFDVEVKWVHLRPGLYGVTAEQVKEILERRIVDDPAVMARCGYTAEEAGERRVGELVIAVGCVVGTTYTGDIDEVAGINQVLEEGGWEIPIHVDAASGGFILPFTSTDVQWDFRLPKVASINVSNHKYGLVYAGLGTLVFRNPAVLPEELVVDIDYLSGETKNFGLNFSRASSTVILQYFNFLRLGRDGYRELIVGCLDRAKEVAEAIHASPVLAEYVEVISKTEYLPIVAVKLRDRWLDAPRFTLDELAKGLEEKGWFAPVYHLPADNERIQVMRIVVRAHFTSALAAALVKEMEAVVGELVKEAYV